MVFPFPPAPTTPPISPWFLPIILFGLFVIVLVNYSMNQEEQQQQEDDYYENAEENLKEEQTKHEVNEDDPSWVSEAGDPLFIADPRFGGY